MAISPEQLWAHFDALQNRVAQMEHELEALKQKITDAPNDGGSTPKEQL